MAVIDFSRTITFSTWFTGSNTLGTGLGDAALINGSLSSTNVSQGINAVASQQGNVASLAMSADADGDGTNSLVDGINTVADEAGRKRISESAPFAYDMTPLNVFGTENDFDAHGHYE